MTVSFVAAYFRRAVTAGRLAHAYLIWGPESEARDSSVRELGRALVCRNGPGENGEPCGQCRVCRETALGTYAGFVEIAGDTATIDIEEIRELAQKLAIAFEARRVVFMPRVDRLTLPAANAFLKTLEEPGGTTVYLLTSSKPANLLPTILSRCHHLALFAAADGADRVDVAEVDAQLADGAALAGMDLGALLDPFPGRNRREKLSGLLHHVLASLEKHLAVLSADGDAESGPFRSLSWDQALDLAEVVLALADDGTWNVNVDLVLEELATRLLNLLTQARQ